MGNRKFVSPLFLGFTRDTKLSEAQKRYTIRFGQAATLAVVPLDYKPDIDTIRVVKSGKVTIVCLTHKEAV